MLENVKFEGEYQNKVLYARNLFLANKKKKEQMYLVVAAVNTQIDMKALTTHLKVGSGNLRGGDADVMEQVLGVKPGAVNLFSILNDTANKVHLIIDQDVINAHSFVGFHPMQNDATTAIKVKDVEKIIELSNHKAEILDFSQLTTTVAAEPKKVEKKPQPKKKEEEKVADVHQLGIEYTKEQNFSKWY